jgi:rhodanese-related sulfurtransferase
MKFVSKDELDQMIGQKEDILIIDVRESYEFEDENLGGMNIPLDELLERRGEIPAEKKVIICCRSGSRSLAMTHTLERKFGLKNLYTLQDGLSTYFGD